MGFFEDFLQQNQNNPLVQRLVQHIAAQIDPYQQTAALATQGQLPLAALKGLQTVVTTAPKAVTDTVGLGLEGFSNIAQAATGGGLLTLIPRFDPGTALEIMQRDRVTVVEGVPTMKPVALVHRL